MLPNQTIDKNAPTIEPLYDTWNYTDSNMWGINIPVDLSLFDSLHKRNKWYANTIVESLNAFSKLARVNSVLCGPLNQNNDVNLMDFKRQEEESYEQYLEKICQAIRDYPVDFGFMSVMVDLYVFVRTPESPERPIRAWIGNNYHAGFELSLEIHDELEDRQPFIYFHVGHSLFCPHSRLYREDNSELFTLNQPLLENALRTWEKALNLGEISELEGLAWIYKYGFMSEEELEAKKASG